MVLTDTPDTTFDKVSMDIVGPPTTDSGYRYIFTIQDLLTKYSVAVKQAMSSKIAEALVEKFINPCRKLGSGFEFYKQRDASYSS
jgi:hypothetical protein